MVELYLTMLAGDLSTFGRQWRYWRINPRTGKLSNGQTEYWPDELHSIPYLQQVIANQERQIDALTHNYQLDLFNLARKQPPDED